MSNISQWNQNQTEKGTAAASAKAVRTKFHDLLQYKQWFCMHLWQVVELMREIVLEVGTRFTERGWQNKVVAEQTWPL